MTAKALQIIVPSGEPTGIKLIKVSGWDGLCYIVPRQSLNELSADSDVNNLFILLIKIGKHTLM